MTRSVVAASSSASEVAAGCGFSDSRSHVEPDPHHGSRSLHPLEQDAGQLAVLDQYVVRPLHLGRDLAHRRVAAATANGTRSPAKAT